MTTERDDSGLLKTWLDETYEAERDAQPFLDRMLDDVSGTQQRRRRWWLHTLRRSPAQPSADQLTEFKPKRFPATNGHSPTVLGRTHSMFTPVKAITAGALVFAIGGVFLIAQPFEQQSSVPGAGTEAIAPAWVTGTVQRAPSCSGPMSLESDGDVRHDWIIECSPQTWTSSDSRLTSEVVRRWNSDVFQTDEGTIEVSTGTAYLRNEGGSWACSDTSLAGGSGPYAEPVTETTYTCIGDGGYEGLSAILVSEDGPNFSEEFVGLIFSGDFPPVPEPPAAD